MEAFTGLVDILGGGQSADMLAALIVALVYNVKKHDAQVSARMADKDKHAQELKECTVLLYETTKRLEAAMNAVGRG